MLTGTESLVKLCAEVRVNKVLGDFPRMNAARREQEESDSKRVKVMDDKMDKLQASLERVIVDIEEHLEKSVV